MIGANFKFRNDPPIERLRKTMFPRYWSLLAIPLFCVTLTIQAQQTNPGPPGQAAGQPSNSQGQPSANPQAQPVGGPTRQLPGDSIRPNYTLNTSDQILIRSNAEEINEKPFLIDADGNINLPLLGRIHAGGMTVQELETDLITRLREYFTEPQVNIIVTQFRSEPIFIVGAFRAPGLYALRGTRTLIEMLTQVGGLQPNASRHIRITRRAEYGPIPLPNAVVDPDKKISTVEINYASLTQSVNPAEDILLQPYDQISAEQAGQIYVTGEVGKIGSLELGERESISIAQVLTMSGGFGRDAMRGKVRILRPIMNTSRRAPIEVDVKRIFEGKDNDVPLLPNDILYVPRSYTGIFVRTVGSMSLSMFPYLLYLVTR